MSMHSIKQVLQALRKEITEALAPSTCEATSNPLQARRVQVWLQLQVEDTPRAKAGRPSPAPRFYVASIPAGRSRGSAAATAPGHSMCIEFSLGDSEPSARTQPTDSGSTAGIKQPAEPPPRRALGAADQRALLDTFSQLLGAPGFDSSARATVLREALEPLSENQVRKVMPLLDGAPRPVADSRVKHARHLLNGILRSGPLKSIPTGGALLMRAFSEFPPRDILSWLLETWKTQDHWLNAS